jgi:hypothetical protein
MPKKKMFHADNENGADNITEWNVIICVISEK